MIQHALLAGITRFFFSLCPAMARTADGVGTKQDGTQVVPLRSRRIATYRVPTPERAREHHRSKDI